jgi:uncharacterized membrane protein YraQ (UPF0718 family)
MKRFMILTFAAVFLSLIFDQEKTWQGLRKGAKMFIGLSPALLNILLAVSILLWRFPKEKIAEVLGYGSGWVGFIIAGVIGPIALIPGFIAYPLAGVLLKAGVSAQILAVFITTLMMVGIVTLPLEAKYFGWRAAILRNILSFIAAFVVGFLMRLFL